LTFGQAQLIGYNHNNYYSVPLEKLCNTTPAQGKPQSHSILAYRRLS